MQNLLLRSYAAASNLFADEAIEYLLEDSERRFSIGYVSTSSVDAVEQLVEVVTPFCSSANFGGLEQAILGYYPERERRADNRRRWGVSQLRLLRNLEPSRLSERGARRLQELRRKFEHAGPLERRSPEGGHVTSPIPESSASKMNDDEWLGAIKHYSSDSPSYEPGKFLGGGLTSYLGFSKIRLGKTLTGLPISFTAFPTTPTLPISKQSSLAWRGRAWTWRP